MTQKQIQLGMFGELHGTLIREGVKMGRNRFKKIERIEHTKAEIKAVLENAGIPTLSLYDQKYYTCSWSVWQEYIRNNLIQLTKWRRDAGDCDNFAFLFAAMSCWVLRVNTCSVAVGPIFDKNSENQIGRHCFSIILAEDFGEIKPILFEPETDFSTEWKAPKTDLGKWGYKVDWLSLF